MSADLEAFIDDLWSCIGKTEIGHLQPETVAFCKAQHERLYHSTDFEAQARAQMSGFSEEK